MSEQLTLYLHPLSPYSQKAELALIEANAPYTGYQIDVFNKPEWFVSKVNSVGKVPTVAYGGPSVNPDEPSPASTKIAESNVILEFLADLYPNSGLLPKDPVSRSKVRFFLNANSKSFEEPLYAFLGGVGSYEDVLKGIEVIQGLLEEDADFAVGVHYTIADASISPHIARLRIITETDAGRFPAGMGFKLGEELKGPKFAKFTKYADRVLQRASFKQTFDQEGVATFFKTFYARVE